MMLAVGMVAMATAQEFAIEKGEGIYVSAKLGVGDTKIKSTASFAGMS